MRTTYLIKYNNKFILINTPAQYGWGNMLYKKECCPIYSKRSEEIISNIMLTNLTRFNNIL